MSRIVIDEMDGDVHRETVAHVAQKATWMVVYGSKTDADPGTAKWGWFDDGELLFAVHMDPDTLRAVLKALGEVDAWMREDGL